VAAVKVVGYRPDLAYMNFDEYMSDVGEPIWHRLLETAAFTPESFSQHGSQQEGLPPQKPPAMNCATRLNSPGKFRHRSWRSGWPPQP
jgi:hypothetical protein